MPTYHLWGDTIKFNYKLRGHIVLIEFLQKNKVHLYKAYESY